MFHRKLEDKNILNFKAESLQKKEHRASWKFYWFLYKSCILLIGILKVINIRLFKIREVRYTGYDGFCGKETMVQVFSCEFYEIFKNTLF